MKSFIISAAAMLSLSLSGLFLTHHLTYPLFLEMYKLSIFLKSFTLMKIP